MSDEQLGHSDVLGEHVDNPDKPRENTEGLFIDAENNEYKVSPTEQRIKGQFELWVCKNAIRAIEEMDAECSNPLTAGRQHEAYMKAKSAGSYNWGGSSVAAALMDLPGNKYFFYLILRRCYPNMTEDEAYALYAENPTQAGRCIGWSLKNSPAPAKPGKKPKARANGVAPKAKPKPPEETEEENVEDEMATLD